MFSNKPINHKACLLLSITLFFCYFLIGQFNIIEPSEIAHQTEIKLQQKEEETKTALEKIGNVLEHNNPQVLFDIFEKQHSSLFREKGIVYLVYENDSLLYWSDNSASVEEYMKEVCLENPVAQLKNGIYEVVKKTVTIKNKGYNLYGLMLIKHQYAYQNTFLKNGFFQDLKLPEDAFFSDKEEHAYTINNIDGKELFKLSFNREFYDKSINYTWVSLILFFTALFFLLVYLKNKTWEYSEHPAKRIIIFSSLLFLLRFLFQQFRFPEKLFQTGFYDPLIFGNSGSYWFANLGDIFINSLLLSWVTNIIYKERLLNKIPEKKNIRKITLIVLATLGFFYIRFIQNIISSLVLNSSLNLQVNNLFDINYLSVAAFVSVGLLFLSVYYYLSAIVSIIVSEFKTGLKFYRITFVVLIIISLSYFFLETQIFVLLIWACLFLIFITISKKKNKQASFLSGIIISLFFSFIISYSFYFYNQKKEVDNNQKIAEKITDSEDAVAEYIFADLRKNIIDDKKLIKLIYSNPVFHEEVEKRIRQVYLGGYWERYQVNFSVFDSLCRSLIPMSNPLLENNSYFDELITKDGLTTASENLFFINKSGEEIKYVGKIALPSDKKQTGKSAIIYFEFIPRGENLKTGFPELLLDQTNFSVINPDKISYAVYKNNKLIRINGSVDYPRKPFWKEINASYFSFSKNGFKHFVFKKDNEISAVISKEENNLLSLFTSNSYFFFIFSLVVWLIFLIKEWGLFAFEKKSGSIRLRIQLLIVTIVLFCIAGLGISTFLFVEKQFKEKNIVSLTDKLDVTENSLHEELSGIPSLTLAYKDYTGWLLKKHAGLNATDISLYDAKGNLFSSSQLKLFNEGIISKKMNPEAYKLLGKDTSNHILIKDNIGNMNFYSAFRPVYANNGGLIGYINLPYFARQTDLEKEWNLYIIAIINIYVILFSLSTVASLIISNIVTKPLQIIQESLSSVKIGKHNAPIIWQSDDELGKLVSEYNKMIQQLENNIIQLAKSEREGAWKEMAKQVAHEIKNPLTPMKLSIQHLERSLEIPPDELKQRIRDLSKMLIEQIDSLAHIASEFSSFAKMPQPALTEYSIKELIQGSIQLFTAYDKSAVNFINDNDEVLIAKIDKDQFCRVINNLIKNAQQSIPDDRVPCIEISLKKSTGNFAQISVSDNGTGIPDNLKDKIFYPNFSSKTDGMGLGLAMAKSIIESFNGTINFNTVINKGTTFTIHLPLI